MSKLLTFCLLLAGPVCASHSDVNLLFLNTYAHHKIELCEHEIDSMYCEDVEMFIHGRMDAYRDMLYIIDFLAYEGVCP